MDSTETYQPANVDLSSVHYHLRNDLKPVYGQNISIREESKTQKVRAANTRMMAGFMVFPCLVHKPFEYALALDMS